MSKKLQYNLVQWGWYFIVDFEMFPIKSSIVLLTSYSECLSNCIENANVLKNGFLKGPFLHTKVQ